MNVRRGWVPGTIDRITVTYEELCAEYTLVEVSALFGRGTVHQLYLTGRASFTFHQPLAWPLTYPTDRATRPWSAWREGVEMTEGTPKKPRGFATMSAERQREIASEGGRAAHQSGHAHQFTRQEAQVAGLKDGTATARARRRKAE